MGEALSLRMRFSNCLSNSGDCGRDSEVSSCLGEQPTKLSSIMVALAATTIVAATCATEAAALESLQIEAGAVFERSCAGCHAGGGNIVQPAATLSKEDLEKNGLAAVDDIYNITYFGKNRMPGYGEKCTPRGQCTFGPRLSEENIRALAEFVKLQADHGWSK
ncbi:unnamed protein product [Calypogeia fissa]